MMATNYPALLEKLQQSLDRALNNQEYHRLMDLDVAIRACVSEAVAMSDSDPDQKAAIAKSMESLMKSYRKVTEACSEKSQSLKAEFSKLSQSKKGAHQYLRVASKY